MLFPQEVTITTDHSAAATSAVLPINCAAFPHLVSPGQVVQVARVVPQRLMAPVRTLQWQWVALVALAVTPQSLALVVPVVTVVMDWPTSERAEVSQPAEMAETLVKLAPWAVRAARQRQVLAARKQTELRARTPDLRRSATQRTEWGPGAHQRLGPLRVRVTSMSPNFRRRQSSTHQVEKERRFSEFVRTLLPAW